MYDLAEMLAGIFFWILLLFVWSTLVLWIIAIWWTRRELTELTPLSVNKPGFLKKEAKISILLPARNEENRVLADCVASLLGQNYRNLEIIAVNDRSVDRTGQLLRGFIQSLSSRLQVIEGAEPPADWLGKPFALRQALEKADGEWILMTDADVIFSPEAAGTAVFYAEENNYDALCLIPFDVCGTFWETVFMPIFSWFRMLKMPPSRVNDPQQAVSMGVGNFFLVRRALLEKINSFENVKSDVAEDLRLAELLKRNGARFRLDYAPDLLRTRMYAGLGEIWLGFTKNFFAGTNFSIGNTFFGAVSIVLFGVLPCLLAVFCAAWWLVTGNARYWWLFVGAILIYICQTIVFGKLNLMWKKPLGYAPLAPLGLAMFALILVNSAARVLTGRGVVWKGRDIYKSDKIKTSKQILEN